MIFGDSPRMTSTHVHRDGMAVHKSNPTANHLGPGSYYTSHNENVSTIVFLANAFPLIY